VKEFMMMTTKEFNDKQRRDNAVYLANRKKSGKYKLSIYNWQPLKNSRLRGKFFFSCFIDNEVDLAVAFNLFRGFFYALYDSATNKKLNAGEFNYDIFGEMENVEGKEWLLVSCDEGPLDFVERQKEQEKERKLFDSYRDPVKIAETIDSAIAFINEVFGEHINREQIRSGWDENVKPLIALSESLKIKR
jgi:hypothetical protein